MALLDRFTPAELLAAAEAADVFPANRAECWGVKADGTRAVWPSAMRAKYP
jgi:hypothetical protein